MRHRDEPRNRTDGLDVNWQGPPPSLRCRGFDASNGQRRRSDKARCAVPRATRPRLRANIDAFDAGASLWQSYGWRVPGPHVDVTDSRRGRRSER